MFLELLYSLSCFCVMPTFLNLYFYKTDLLYKKELMTVMVSQSIIGWTSDNYSLISTNYLSKLLIKLDTIHVSCLALPFLFYYIYINNLNYEIEYFFYALLFWINQRIIYRNKGNNKQLYKLALWNHIGWHYFIGLFIYNSFDNI